MSDKQWPAIRHHRSMTDDDWLEVWLASDKDRLEIASYQGHGTECLTLNRTTAKWLRARITDWLNESEDTDE